jgi:hypothetical protein
LAAAELEDAEVDVGDEGVVDAAGDLPGEVGGAEVVGVGGVGDADEAFDVGLEGQRCGMECDAGSEEA